MPIVRWMAVAVAAVVAIVSLTACTGDDRTPMEATLTDDGCTYEGDTEVAAGSFQIAVSNQTQHGANFLLVRLANGYTAATIKPILAKETAWARSLTKNELRDLLDGLQPGHYPGAPLDLPQIFDFRHGSSTDIGAGESSVVPGGGSPSGAYALICRVNLLHNSNAIFREQYVASPIEVTGDLP